MKRFLIILSIALPAIILTFFWLFPEYDAVWQQPLFHFYIVTFFTFTAVVVALFTAITLGDESAPRHQLLVTAFAVMAFIFFIHGVSTPGAIFLTFNPAIRWAAWLTLFTGGMIFLLASFDTLQRPLKQRQRQFINWSLALFCGAFVLIVIFAPEWLGAIDEQAAPWHEQIVAVLTFILWVLATIRLTLNWQQTRDRVDGTMALIAAWFAIGTISLHGFTLWQLSWWLYHVQLLLGAVTAVYVLILEYEKLRQFRLTYYYAALGLIVTAALALFASQIISKLVEQNLTSYLEEEALLTAVVQARFNGLLIAAFSTGLLYLIMMLIVHRADRIITSRNDELALAYDNLQLAEAMRDDLTDMIVHDLRSPLTSIKLSLELMRKARRDDDKFRQLFDRSQYAMQQMMVLIDQLLDIARLETGQLQLNRSQLSMNQLLQEKAIQFAPQAESGQKTIKINTKADLPQVRADRELMSRVLDNLIGNALKFTDANGHITLQAEKNRELLYVHVIDDGEGIDTETAANIFDKFHQARNADGTPLRQGTGLGLTFCKMVVEAHHGRIWVVSTVGQGSTFSFSLPLN